jgi:hypothetical protein
MLGWMYLSDDRPGLAARSARNVRLESLTYARLTLAAIKLVGGIVSGWG